MSYIKRQAAINKVFDTLYTFSYYMRSKSMFYELLIEMRSMKCDCGKNIGEKFLLFLLKMHGGDRIDVPAVEEIEYYKFLIHNPTIIAEAYNQKNESIEHYISRTMIEKRLKPVSEISLKEIIVNFCKVAYMLTDEEETIWRKKRKMPSKIKEFSKK